MVTIESWDMALTRGGSRYPVMVQRDGEWLVGWLDGINGVNAQEQTVDELMSSLEAALDDILNLSR